MKYLTIAILFLYPFFSFSNHMHVLFSTGDMLVLFDKNEPELQNKYQQLIKPLSFDNAFQITFVSSGFIDAQYDKMVFKDLFEKRTVLNSIFLDKNDPNFERLGLYVNESQIEHFIDIDTITKNYEEEQKIQLPTPPKRALSSYNIFFHDQKELLTKENGNKKLPFAELGKTIGQRWKKVKEDNPRLYSHYQILSNRDKIRYLSEKEKYQQEREEYKRKMKEYRSKL